MGKASEVFTLRKKNIFALPIIPYNMEFAAQVRLAFSAVQPDCIAIELPETLEKQFIHAASRLPDISIIASQNEQKNRFYQICEPCDPLFEAIRLGLENETPLLCIGFDQGEQPKIPYNFPDPYALQRIGLKPYYESYKKYPSPSSQEQEKNATHLAHRLKELALKYETILFVGHISRIDQVLSLLDQKTFPDLQPIKRYDVGLFSPSEECYRDLLAESGWFSKNYEQTRQYYNSIEDNLLFENKNDEEGHFPPDRQQLLYQLYKACGEKYKKNSDNNFAGYQLRNTMKFVRNYALITERLMPDLFQLLSAAKGCVDHNYAYEVWELATEYPYRRNIDNLPELNLTIEEVWGESKLLQFHLKQNSRKGFQQEMRRRKDKKEGNYRFHPPGPFSICSHQPEDLIVENFGDYLRKKGTQILSKEASSTIPFTTSLEDGVDTKETIRNWHQRKLFVKVLKKPPGGTGSVVLIFDEDKPTEEGKPYQQKYPWCATWQGEHNQESDMALYATDMGKNVVGPGISRCEYGGFMMSYPPQRVYDIWRDRDYAECRSKAEVLLMAAIDYAIEPVVVYVAAKPPRQFFKSFARRFGKKVVYIPIGQLSSVLLNKIRVFHVLSSHDKREIADEYIF